MDSKTRAIVKWFWAWQDRKREEWLEEMSLDGWHLVSISMLGIFFKFVQDEPKEYIYRIDYRIDNKESLQDYHAFIEDAGWEHVESHNGWQYFRKPTSNGKGDEIFTENESKIKKYRRVMVTLAIFWPGVLIVFFPNIEKYPDWFTVVLISVFVFLALFIGTSIIGIALRIATLRRQG